MSQRTPLLAGNWKMNKTVEESVAFANALHASLPPTLEVDVVVAPTTLAVASVAHTLQNSPIQVSAQNVHPQPSGAYTGEVSPAMLQGVGCTYCIIGHSERRHYFGEQDSFLAEKLQALLAQGLRPILCLGESLEEREAGTTFTKVKRQLLAAMEGLSEEQALQVVVAYEPIWAIGTGKTASPEQAQEVHAFLRSELKARFSAEVSAQIRILYGGSVKPKNVKELMAQADIDGALVGGASLKVETFLPIIQFQNPE